MRERTCKHLIAVISAILFIVGFPSANVWAYDVDTSVRFFDTRSDRADTSGSLLTNVTLNSNESVGDDVWIVLMDQDGNCIDYAAGCAEGDDDVLASTTTTGGSANFSNVGSGQDVYIWTDYSTNTSDLELFDHNGNNYVSHSYTRWNISSNQLILWNITCPDDAFNTWDGECDSATDVNTYFDDEQAWADILISMKDVDDRFTNLSLHRNGNSQGFDGYYPDSSYCSPLDGGGCSRYTDIIVIGADAYHKNHVVAHEMGHLMHKRSLDLTTATLGGGCSWSWGGTASGEKCAVNEGFADFTAGVTYFSNDASEPWVANSTQKLEGDISGDPCVDWGGSNMERVPGNVARFFWDLWDTTNETQGIYSDATSWPHGSGLCDTWDRFPAGTDDREASESGSDGRNAWDFDANEAESGDAYDEINMNCLWAQEP